MDEQWPPKTAEVRKDFKKAHDHEDDQQDARSGNSSAVSQKIIQDLESRRKKNSPHLDYTPFGTKKKTGLTSEEEKRIARMKESLKRQSRKAREDFGRSM